MANRTAGGGDDLTINVSANIDDGKIRSAADATNQLAAATNNVVAAEQKRVAVLPVIVKGTADMDQAQTAAAQNIQAQTAAVTTANDALQERVKLFAQLSSSVRQAYGGTGDLGYKPPTAAEFGQLDLAQQSAEYQKLQAAVLAYRDAQKTAATSNTTVANAAQKLTEEELAQIQASEKVVESFYAQLRPANELASKYEALQKAGISNAEIAKVYGKEILTAASAQRAMGQELPKVVEELEKEAQALQKTQSPFVTFGKNIQEFVKHPIESLKGGAASLVEGLGPVGTGLIAVAGASALVGEKAWSASKAFADECEHLERMSAAIGVTAEEYQKLQAVGQMKGIGDLAGRLSFLQMQLGRESSGPFVTALHAYGIATEDMAKNSKPILTLMQEFSKSLMQIQDPMRRYEVALGALGRYNRDWALLLANDKDKFFELMNTIGEYGGILDNETVKKEAERHEAFTKLGLAAKGVGNFFKEVVADSINPFAHGLLSLIEKMKEFRQEQDKLGKENPKERWQEISDELRKSYMAKNVGSAFMGYSGNKLPDFDLLAKRQAAEEAWRNQAKGVQVTAQPPEAKPIDPQVQLEIMKAHYQRIAANKENLALYDQLTAAQKKLEDSLKRLTVGETEEDKATQREVAVNAAAVRELQNRVKAADAVSQKMGDIAEKEIKYQQQALDAVKKSGQGDPEGIARAQTSIFKLMIDNGKKLTDEQINQLQDYVKSSDGIIRNQAIPVFKDFVEKATDEFGQLPPALQKTVYDMANDSSQAIRSQFLPVWEKATKDINSMSADMVEASLAQMTQGLGSQFADVRDVMQKQLLEWVKNSADAMGNIPEVLRAKLIDLMRSSDPQMQAAGAAAYDAYIQGFLKKSGTIPVSETSGIIEEMHSLSPLIAEQGVKHWKSYVDGAVKSLDKLPENFLMVLNGLMDESEPKIIAAAEDSFNKYVEAAIAAGKDLSEMLPYIDKFVTSSNSKIATAAQKWHTDYVRSITNSAGRVSDAILPQIMKKFESGNATYLKMALSDWEAWKSGVLNSLGYIPDEGLPIIDYLLNSKVPELLKKGESDWDIYAQTAVNAFQKIFEQIGSAQTYRQFSDAIQRLIKQMESAFETMGSLPSGVGEKFASLMLQTKPGSGLQQKMLSEWQKMIQEEMDVYGNLPDWMENVNQKLIMQQEHLAIKLREKTADAFAGMVEDFDTSAAEILIEGGKLIDALTEDVKKMGKSVIKAMLDSMMSPIKDVFRQLGSALGKMLQEMVKPVSDAMTNVLKKILPKFSLGDTQMTPGDKALIEAAGTVKEAGIVAKQNVEQMSSDFVAKIEPPSNELNTSGGILQRAGEALIASASALQTAAASMGAGNATGSFLNPAEGDWGNMLEKIPEGELPTFVGEDYSKWLDLPGYGNNTPGGGSSPKIDWGGTIKGLAGTAGTMMFLDSLRHLGTTRGYIEGAGGGAMAGYSMASQAGLPGWQGAMIGGGGGLMLNGWKGSGAGSWAGAIGGGALAGAGIGTMILPGIGTAIGAIVGAVVGTVGKLIMSIKGKNSYEAGSMEAARDFGDVDISSKQMKEWLDAKGISESQAYPFRKPLESSPDFLVNQLWPLAQQQGKQEEFLKSLENIGFNKDTSINLRDEFELGDLTGDWTLLDKTWTDLMEKSHFLDEIPNWKEKLTLNGDAIKQTASYFEQMFVEIQKSSEYLPEMTDFLKENAEALDAAAEKSSIFKEQLNEMREAAERYAELKPVITGFQSLKDAISSATPTMLNMYDLFLSTGKITDNLSTQIKEYGGDLAAFEAYSGIAQLNNYFAEMVQHFEDTGEILPDLRQMVADYGRDLSKLDAAAALPNLKKSIADMDDFASSLEQMLPDLTGLQEVLEGNWGSDVIQKLSDAGLDPNQFEKMSKLLKIEKDWDSEVQNFLSGKRMKVGGSVMTALQEYGGAEGQRALDLYGKGQNILTPTWLENLKDKLDSAFGTERTKVLDYLAGIRNTTEQSITSLKDDVDEQLSLVADSLSTALSTAAQDVVDELDLILKAVNNIVITGQSTTSNTTVPNNTDVGNTENPGGGTWGPQYTAWITEFNRILSEQGYYAAEAWREQNPEPPTQYSDGGPVLNTGMAFLHKGEFVLSKAMLDSLQAVTQDTPSWTYAQWAAKYANDSWGSGPYVNTDSKNPNQFYGQQQQLADTGWTQDQLFNAIRYAQTAGYNNWVEHSNTPQALALLAGGWKPDVAGTDTYKPDYSSGYGYTPYAPNANNPLQGSQNMLFRPIGATEDDLQFYNSQEAIDKARAAGLPQYASGGAVPNTGLAVLHAGEYVLSTEMLKKLFDTDHAGKTDISKLVPFPLGQMLDQFLLPKKSETSERGQQIEPETPTPLPPVRKVESGDSGGSRAFGAPNKFEFHIHCEGATFNGMSDFNKQVADSVTKWFDGGGFPFMRKLRTK